MNSVNLIGRLTKNIEIQYTTDNTAFTKFSIAVNRNFKNKNGEYEADFINCTAFKNNAEFLQKYFSKGQMVGISGCIRTRKWVDNDGNNKYATEILVEKATFTEGKKANGNTGSNVTGDPFESESELESDTLPF